MIYKFFSIADDGDGIDEKDMPHLFERCYKGRGGNFGIGLAIAHSAAEKVGGVWRRLISMRVEQYLRYP